VPNLESAHEKGDPYDVDRFVYAQEHDHARALVESREGRKRSHWMWYVFPQLAGLGSSPMAERYAIRNLADADAYFRHPVLGPRLVLCAEAALGVAGRSASEIFGTPDDLKLRSCATLFARVSPPGSAFHRLLDRFFGGQPDPRTLALLQRRRGHADAAGAGDGASIAADRPRTSERAGGGAG
jgi:uncharacterized protein (DUF1810 family)